MTNSMLTEKSLVKVYMAVYSVHDQLVDTTRSAASHRGFSLVECGIFSSVWD